MGIVVHGLQVTRVTVRALEHTEHPVDHSLMVITYTRKSYKNKCIQ